MKTNKICEVARDLSYVEFSIKWVWNPKDKIWIQKKQKNQIERIIYIHPSSSELYYLRILLNVIKRSKSYDEIKIINSILHPTFRSACNTLGLLGDDGEWHEALNEASYWASSSELR